MKNFVTFKDGKIGVNFGGYHADAGLGGLLTGNAAHGGLSASAGTPWGPQAAAGLNGNLDGRAAGGAYAGAQFSPDIGASSVLGGSVGNGQHGFAGAEAHSNGNTVSKSIGGMGGPSYEREYVGAPTAGPATNIDIPKTNHVQKIKPPKKYSLIRPEDVDAGAELAHAKQVSKTYTKSVVPSSNLYHDQQPLPNAGYHHGSAGLRVNSGLVGNVLNIPIGILRSLQESLSGIDVSKSVSYTKSV